MRSIFYLYFCLIDYYKDLSLSCMLPISAILCLSSPSNASAFSSTFSFAYLSWFISKLFSLCACWCSLAAAWSCLSVVRAFYSLRASRLEMVLSYYYLFSIYALKRLEWFILAVRFSYFCCINRMTYWMSVWYLLICWLCYFANCYFSFTDYFSCSWWSWTNSSIFLSLSLIRVWTETLKCSSRSFYFFSISAI